MQTVTVQLTDVLSIEDQKAAALLSYHGEKFFVYEDELWVGDFKEAIESFISEHESRKLSVEEDYTFLDFLSENYENGTLDENYIVLTDEEADREAANYIRETLWAFNPEFLAGQTDIHVEVFRAIQSNGKCEDNNDAIESCIKDMDSFIAAAISADGRGHFLSSYDGHEHEITLDSETFYIYRIG